MAKLTSEERDKRRKEKEWKRVNRAETMRIKKLMKKEEHNRKQYLKRLKKAEERS